MVGSLVGSCDGWQFGWQLWWLAVWLAVVVVGSCGGCRLWLQSLFILLYYSVKLFLFFCVLQNQEILMISFRVLIQIFDVVVLTTYIYIQYYMYIFYAAIASQSKVNRKKY